MTEDEMVGWHNGLNGLDFEQTLGDGEGQRSLVCCSPWGGEEWDMKPEDLDQGSRSTRPRGCHPPADPCRCAQSFLLLLTQTEHRL